MASAEEGVKVPPIVLRQQADNNVMPTEFLPFPTKRCSAQALYCPA